MWYIKFLYVPGRFRCKEESHHRIYPALVHWLYWSGKIFLKIKRDKPARQCGFYGPFIRALMDALLIFSPAHLMGETPPMEFYQAIFPARTYYTILIWLALLIYSSNVWWEVG
jgi:hypothetical protein